MRQRAADRSAGRGRAAAQPELTPRCRACYAESVLVVADMGVQLTVSYRFGGQSCRFIDMADVQDVLVNEGIARQRTRYYLAFVVRGEDKLVLAFQHEDFTPRLDDLLCVYRGTRETCGLLMDTPTAETHTD